jgi:subtilisin family serine protease
VIHVYKDSLVELSYQGAITEDLKGIVIPRDPVTNEPMISEQISDYDVEPLTVDDIQELSPSIYTNAYLTHAQDVWGDTAFGSGSLVVIIDTGVWSASPMLVGNVIGGEDISADVGTSYQGYNLPTNNNHGTFCAHLLAAHATLRFGATSTFGNAIYRYDPEGNYKDAQGRIYVPCTGIAPSASIYGIKVFPHTGAGAPTSTIMQGIDTAIQMKLNGTRDVDVISMSLGGPILADGEDPENLLVDAATQAGIMVVAAAGNKGPAPLKVDSPGCSKTAIAVGAAMDPIHEHVIGDIYYGPWMGQLIWYPHDEMSIVDFSSRGPSADGRIKPEVVATGSWCFLGLWADGFVYIGGGTSFSCPQVAGEAALLNAYIEQNSLSFGPTEIKEAIYDGAEPIPGFDPMEQGAGYVNALNSLNVIKSAALVPIPTTWPHHFDSLWFPPINTICLHHGKTTVDNVILEPGKYTYYSFWVNTEVDSIKVKLSNVQLADPELQNPAFGDAGVLYMSRAERGGVQDSPTEPSYYFYGLYFTGDGEILYTSDVPFEPGVVRLVLAGDFSSYNAVTIGELTIEITEVCALSIDKTAIIFNAGVPVEAEVDVYPGKIVTFCGSVKEGEADIYNFNIPDADGFAYVFLYWYRDWAHWATSDLDLVITNPDATLNFDGATLKSPETAFISGPGDYVLEVDGYQIYFGKTEYYYLEIVYFASPTPLWSSPTFNLACYAMIKSPVTGLAVVWLHDLDFDAWYIGAFTQLKKMSCGPCPKH